MYGLATSNGMKNFTTFNVESWLGSVFVLALAGFFIGLFFIFMKNYDADLVTASSLTISDYGSPRERIQVEKWIAQNGIKNIPSGLARLHYLISKYPDRPWLDPPSN